MRTMLRWSVPAAAGNRSIADGSMQKSIETLLGKLKPEAAYFFAVDGKRGGLVVFDMVDSSSIPLVVEPLFQAYEAEVELQPVMNADDLKQAFAKLAS